MKNYTFIWIYIEKSETSKSLVILSSSERNVDNMKSLINLHVTTRNYALLRLIKYGKPSLKK